MIKRLRPSCLLLATLCLAAGVAAADNVLTVTAKESSAQLEPRAAKQPQVTLPALDVAITASLACPGGARAASVTFSVSDTHQYFGVEQLANAVSLDAALSIPANQLAPVIVPKFCVGERPTDKQPLVVSGIATAQVSLRCLGEDESASMHFASVPVSVRLYCRAAGDPESSAVDR